MRKLLSLLGVSFLFVDQIAADDAISQLRGYLVEHVVDSELGKQPFAQAALSREQARSAQKLIWNRYAESVRTERKEEMASKRVKLGAHTMPFFAKKFGTQPKDGWSVYISMHGGGGTAARVNDQQWENQKRLYQLEEGIYLVPRAPTNAWNLWHQGHIDDFFDRLITNMIGFEGANPNRVYIMGYSAGGDGVFQLAPRMADRLAAAAMMAGHPNETVPNGLRNIGFAIYMGGNDAAYNRNKVAADWKTKLAALQKTDPKGYPHEVTIYPGMGHWMNRKDAVAVPWLAKFTRDPLPKKVVWRQDDVTHSRFYWLGAPRESRKRGVEIVATRDQNVVTIERTTAPKVTVLLNDQVVDLDKPVTIRFNGKAVFEGKVARTIAGLVATTIDRGDPELVFSASVTVDCELAK